LLDALDIDLSVPRQAQELHPQALLARGAPLREQRLRMVRILDILVAIVTANMAGDELVQVVNAHPVGVRLHGQALTGKLGRHRIAVAVQRDAELLRCPLALDATDVLGQRIERAQT